MRTLVTGGRGFIGSCVAQYFDLKGADVRISSRQCSGDQGFDGIECCSVSNLSSSNNWSKALTGVDVVIHCAGRAHILRDSSLDPLGHFRIANRDGTLNLARQAANMGVKRFVFLSTIGVNGSASIPGKPFSEVDVPAPHGPYALSKLEAELGLFEISMLTGMEVVIIRPPLVYGYSAPGNFSLLVKVIRNRIPLPFGAIKNLRSMVFVENLADFIYEAARHPLAANQIFLICDGEDLSIGKIVLNLSKAMKLNSILVPLPPLIVSAAAKFFGAHAIFDKLCGTLQVDSSKATKLLGWSPPFSLDEGFSRSV